LLEFSVLSSGSSGNALYLRSATTQLLLDAGISGRQLQTRMEAVGACSFDELDGVLITHEHIDHVRGLKQVLKHSQTPVYTTEGTWSQIVMEEYASRWHGIQDGKGFSIGDILVQPFAVSHDAEEPVAFRFSSHGDSVAVVTDLGYMSEHIKSIIEGCQAYVLETNHDVEMLRAGRYPWSVKRRILSDKGHLSNHDAAVALADLLGDGTVDVYLAHLSQENNQPDLAEITVQSLLREMKPSYLEQTRLFRTSRYQPTQIHTFNSVRA